MGRSVTQVTSFVPLEERIEAAMTLVVVLLVLLVLILVLLVLLELLVVLLLDHRVGLRRAVRQFRCRPLLLLLFTLSPDVTESGRAHDHILLYLTSQNLGQSNPGAASPPPFVARLPPHALCLAHSRPP